MALYDLHLYLFQLKNDPAMQQAFERDPEAQLAGRGLDPAAVRAILDKDVVTLWEMGVHPLLLVPLSRFFGMPPPAYRDALRPHAGKREFRSTFGS